MTSKAEYLKKYLSKEDGGSGKKKKKIKKQKKQSNLAILDDDVDWKALVPKFGDVVAGEEDPDDAPIVMAIHDEEAERLHPKWQPVMNKKDNDSDLNSPRGGRRVESPDLSPPRKLDRRRRDSSDLSPPRRRGGRREQSPDLSPPRKSARRGGSPDLSPLRRGKGAPNQSPPRRSRRRGNSPDVSPLRREQTRHVSHDLNTDLSPPKRRQKSAGVNPSRTLEKRRHDSPDLSPSRRHDSPDLSPRRRHDSPDLSPARPSGRHDSPDLSPARPRRRHDSSSDPSPTGRHDSPDSDLSPPRKSSKHGGDLSPPRRGTVDSKGTRTSRWGIKGDAADGKPSKGVAKLASGATAGLQAAELLRRENAETRDRQETFYKTLDPTVSGKHAETVYRDKEGRKIDPKMERARKREEERRKEEENEQFMEWGRGIAQTKKAHERVSDELYEMSKPLARYADDEDLERMLREREREGDPMLAFIRSKKVVQATQEGRPRKERPSYKGSFPPNRFGLRPGYRWDGVNRSNGFEKAWFSREANKVATSEEAYKWSVEDM